MCEITENSLKLLKKVENRSKKYFDQLSGAHSTQKMVEIHNTQYLVHGLKQHFLQLDY